ncbi:MAG: T9SS type A sorting domain-containing protein [Calditrichaeota bacterium]|nr:T9SS type A sorting domain-containing protein [Calditrichota bacterium]
MRKWQFLVIFLVLFLVSGLRAEEKKVVRIHLENQSEEAIKNLYRLDPDMLTETPQGETIDALVTSEQLKKIHALNFETSVLIPDTKSFEKTLRAEGYFDHFHSYDQIVQEMKDIELNHPGIAKLYDIGDSWEKTAGIADRDIWALKISDNVETEEIREPEVLYMALHHAREIITPEILLYWMHYLVNNYGTDSTITSIVNHRQIWIIPLVNPDGFEYVRNKDMWWRKNRRRNSDGSYGVDLNRNYSFKWGLDNIGSSGRPSSNVYRGIAPFSEPETQAIRDLVEAHHFVISLSFHSYGRMFLYPWGYIAEDTPDNSIFKAIADSVTAYNGYDAGNVKSGTIYLVNGECDDWLYGEQQAKFKLFGFTPEVGTSFHPDTTQIMPQILANLKPIIYVARAAERYSLRPEFSHTPLSDREDTSQPVPVSVQVTASPFGLDTSTVFLHYRESEQDTFHTERLEVIPGSSIFVATIPAPNRSVRVQYYFSAADTIPRTGYLPKNAPDSLFSFSIGEDRIPPQIFHHPMEDQSILQDSIKFTARVTDNIGVDSVWVIYRINGGRLHRQLMTAVDSVGDFGMTLPIDSLKVNDVVEYQILALDRSSARNFTRLPETGYYSFKMISSYYFSFESAPVFTTNASSDWQWGVPTSGPGVAFSGKNLWATNLSGNYKNSSDSKLDSPVINLTNASTARLTFWHWYKMEYSQSTFWDGGNIEISVDDSNFVLVTPLGGYDGVIDNSANVLDKQPVFGGPETNGNHWQQETVDLTPYLGHKIRVRFHFGSDAYVSDAGWYIDDVRIQLTPTAVALADGAVAPLRFELGQNYPNPFGGAADARGGNWGGTTIHYQLAKTSGATLTIFNVLGQVVRRFRFERQTAGAHQVVWDGRNARGRLVGAGVYFYALQAGKFHAVKKMIVLQ